MQRNIHLGAHEACQVLIKMAADRWAEEEGDYRDDVRACNMMIHISILKKAVNFNFPFE